MERHIPAATMKEMVCTNAISLGNTLVNRENYQVDVDVDCCSQVASISVVCSIYFSYLNFHTGPTKWLHLTPSAHAFIDPMHFSIWKEVWVNPHSMVEVADRVSKEILRYYFEFMVSDCSYIDSDDCSKQTLPLVRVKVIPASFGLEGFEDGIWEATQDLIPRCIGNQRKEAASSACKKAITFVVASPDLTDPTLTSKDTPKSSSQTEFASESFREFTNSLEDKLKLFSKMEGMPVDEMVKLEAFHPMWKERRMGYPCVAVCAEVNES